MCHVLCRGGSNVPGAVQGRQLWAGAVQRRQLWAGAVQDRELCSMSCAGEAPVFQVLCRGGSCGLVL